MIDIKTDKSILEIEEILLEKKIISQDQLMVAKQEQKMHSEITLVETLVKMGFITESAIGEILNDSENIETLDIKSAIIDQRLTKRVPKDFALQNKVIPISVKDEVITIAVSDVYDILTIDQIKRFFPAKYQINTMYAPATDIVNAINQYYDYEMSIDGILKEIEGSKEEDASQMGDYKSPTVRLVDALLTDAVKQGASDIHFQPENFFLRLRYRISGNMEQIRTIHKKYWSSISVRIKIMSGMNIAETRKAQDGRIQSNILGRRIAFRVSSQPTVDGENIVMRILDEKQSILSLDKLGYSQRAQNILKKCVKKPEGVIIMTGPTGSGKTTTLYTILSMINTIDKNIMTLENPVEYRLPLIRQSNINPEAGFTFADGIRTLLRQDPNVIMVGEIRDQETAVTAMQAAMTGHQVYSSLHTNDAFSAIPRLLNMGVAPFLLAGTLICVAAQRLSRRLCVHCREEVSMTNEEKKVFAQVMPEFDSSQKIYKAKGCQHCKMSGYKGRTSVNEILDIDEEIDDMITKQASKKDMMSYINGRGFASMQRDGVEKIMNGDLDLDELMKVVDMTQYL